MKSPIGKRQGGKLRVMVIVGSRPEAIKMTPIVFELLRHADTFEPILCSTGQQRDMIPQALSEFGLSPDIDLDVMEANQSLAGLTSRLAVRLDTVLGQIQPDWVLVQGDTTSTMVGALTSFYRQIPVGHVEAGLRTDDRYSPFPEEINRRIITQCATLHFAATEANRRQLLMERIKASDIFVTGNTVIDALLWMRDKTSCSQAPILGDNIAQILNGHRMILVTAHRRESFGHNLENICSSLVDIVHKFNDVAIIFPVHPNPCVKQAAEKILANQPRILRIEPQPYRELVKLMSMAYLILTDSGGLQEEAPSLGKPVLVLREKTERREGIEAGNTILVGTDRSRIVAQASELLTNETAYKAMTSQSNPYGDGKAAERIVSILTDCCQNAYSI